MKKDFAKLIKELEANGYRVRRTSKGHYQVLKGNRSITYFAGTPSDRRSWDNSMAPLKRDGFQWPRH